MRYGHGQTDNTHLNTHVHSPGIPAVETEGDLIDTARVSHHQVKTGLKAEGMHKRPSHVSVYGVIGVLKDAGKVCLV